MSCALLLDGIVRDFRGILGGKLVGIYVHGSIAFGCFRWEVSDVDFLAVVDAPLAHEEKLELIRAILRRVPDAPEKGMEMSVVTLDVCRDFVYPTPYELHFSNAWLEAYRADIEGCCARCWGVDYDLAAHFAVTRAVGIAWYGRPVAEVFGAVPEEALLDSILRDVSDAQDGGIVENPVYYVLNLCRAMAYMEDGLLLSKAGGGEWGLEHLPSRHHAVVRGALDAYAFGGEMDGFDLEPFLLYCRGVLFGA